MQRLSIARSMRLALLGLTVALGVIAALGVARLYSVRQHYEDVLLASSSLQSATATLRLQALADEITLGASRGGRAARARALDAYRASFRQAAWLAATDPISAKLLRGAALTPARAPAVAATLQARQLARERAARVRARSDSRQAVLVAGVAGALALIAALALVTVLLAAMRAPLGELVDATRDLAAGNLKRRVRPAGPNELEQLGEAFNAMGEGLVAAQAGLERERRRLAVTIESMGDGLIVTESGSGRIATTNPRARELVPEPVAAGKVDATGSPLPALEAALVGETILEHGGRTLAVSAAPLSERDGGAVWTVRDVSERARLERAKTHFVATVSHELRSPLTSIKGFIELLASSPQAMSERQREFVQIIRTSTERLVELVADLLDVARIDADHVQLNLRPIDVGEAVQEVADLMRPRLSEKRQWLGLYIAPRLPSALADPNRVRQIVGNLLTNAHLYTPAGGRIHIGVEPDRAWVQIVVADSGVGIAPDETERIFERFYSIRDGSSAGTGLGLSIVKSLVELHNGVIDIESELGRGTTFTVRLPAATAGDDRGRSLRTIQGRHVLVVDDERDIAELIAGQLEPLDVSTRIAASGEEALALLRAERFDAVTLDILMPGLDGFAVLQEIRADPELRALPIVFVSVISGRSELAGEWAVSKPIDADELRDVLGAAVRADRSRVLVVGRPEMQPVLEPALDELGIEHEWEFSGPAAARVCEERRFEVALIDVGVRNPRAVLQALDLRGRRRRRSVILFGDESTPAPPGGHNLGMEVVPVDQAADALLAALRGEAGGWQ